MGSSNFELESAAYDALKNWVDDAKKVKTAFERASLPLPPTLARALGHEDASKRRSPAAIRVEEPERPVEAKEGWVWLPITEALTISLVKAVLRGEEGPVKPKDVIDRIADLRNDLASGGVYNSAPRLIRDEIIEKVDGMWRLIAPDRCPVIKDVHLWGNPENLQKQEVAAHRRLLIVHLLEVFPGGLQVLQVVEQLKKMEQCKSPVTKDLVKADMTAMQDDKRVKRAGNSKKWVLTNQEEE